MAVQRAEVARPTDPATSRLGPARLGDVGAIAAVYLQQSPESRRFFHPLPFDRGRLLLLLTTMVALRPFARLAQRVYPEAGVLLWVARDGRSGPVDGFATGRLHRGPERSVSVRTGLYVVPGRRRSGVGLHLEVALLRACQRMGVPRAEAIMASDNEASRRLHAAVGFEIAPYDYVDRRSETRDHLLASLDLRRWQPPRGTDPERPDP